MVCEWVVRINNKSQTEFTHSRLWVVPLLLSPSCVKRKKTAGKEMCARNLEGEKRAIFSRDFLSRHARRTKRKRDCSYSYTLVHCCFYWSSLDIRAWRKERRQTSIAGTRTMSTSLKEVWGQLLQSRRTRDYEQTTSQDSINRQVEVRNELEWKVTLVLMYLKI